MARCRCGRATDAASHLANDVQVLERDGHGVYVVPTKNVRIVLSGAVDRPDFANAANRHDQSGGSPAIKASLSSFPIFRRGLASVD